MIDTIEVVRKGIYPDAYKVRVTFVGRGPYTATYNGYSLEEVWEDILRSVVRPYEEKNSLKEEV